MFWRAIVTVFVTCSHLARAAEDNGPCTGETLKLVRQNVLNYVGDVLERARAVIEPHAEVYGEHFLLLLSQNLCSPLLGLFEAYYLQICQLTKCEHCALEQGLQLDQLPPKEASFQGNFEMLADRLELFTDMFDSAIEMAEIEEEARRSTSPLPERRGITASIRADLADLREQALAPKLDVQFVRSMRDLDGPGAETKLKETTVLVRNMLVVLHSHVSQVLNLIPLLAAEARHLPGIQIGWAHEPFFKYLLRNPTSSLASFALFQGTKMAAWSFTRTSALCDQSYPPPAGQSPILETPARDASGSMIWHGAPAYELLQTMARAGHPLSHTYWSVQPATNFGKEISCDRAVGLFFDAARCLHEKGWGGSVYFVNPDPKPREKERLYIQWRGRAWNDERTKETPLWKAYLDPLTPPSEPMDVLTLSPLAGNCELLHKMLTADSMTMARLVYAPINPVVPPPLETQPNFTDFWVSHRAWSRAQKKEKQRLEESASRYFQAQCSLETVHRMMRPLGYELMHVEHVVAVFAHHSVAGLLRKTAGSKAGSSRKWPAMSPMASPTTFEAWRVGWYCSPVSRYLLELEVRSQFNPSWVAPEGSRTASYCSFRAQQKWLTGDREGTSCGGFGEELPVGGLSEFVKQRRRAVWAVTPAHPAIETSEILRGLQGHVEERFVCDEDFPSVCSCLPPFRGASCDSEDAGIGRQRAAAITYAVAEQDAENGVQSLAHSLSSLWKNFNSRHDYPVLIFHGSLRSSVRESLSLASPNRVWFFPVSSLRREAGVRATQRFKTAALFRQPAVASLEFIWNLDMFSYFPAAITVDPFQQLADASSSSMLAFRRLARMPDSAASHRVEWEYTHLYLLDRGLDVDAFFNEQGTLAASLLEHREGELPSWNRLAIGSDCEVLRVASFMVGSSYADYITFMDAHGEGGRHYDAAVMRTLGVAVANFALELTAIELDFPYSWRDFCSCGVPSSTSGNCVRSLHESSSAALQGLEPTVGMASEEVWTCITP